MDRLSSFFFKGGKLGGHTPQARKVHTARERPWQGREAMAKERGLEAQQFRNQQLTCQRRQDLARLSSFFFFFFQGGQPKRHVK